MKRAKRAVASTQVSTTPALDVHICEAEIAEGLEQTARDEIVRILGERAHLITSRTRWSTGAVRFSYQGDLNALRRLQTVQAVYLVQTFTVPRPRALLGDEHFRTLLRQIALVRSLLPRNQYRSLHLSAAGSDTAVMLRLKEALAASTQLEVDPAKGDLLIRLRPIDIPESGWEVLIRLTPRPLAARSWRIANYEGALNAAVAHAMVLMTEHSANETYVNIGCGSATLLIERAACGPAGRIIGIDINPQILKLAQTNIAASGFGNQISLCLGDACTLPLSSQSVDSLTADLPFGQSVGSHQGNLILYPRLLAEAARVARSGAHCVLITHEVRLLEQLLAQSLVWETDQIQRVTLRGLHPRIYVLRRRA